jgi:hypothetical protein
VGQVKNRTGLGPGVRAVLAVAALVLGIAALVGRSPVPAEAAGEGTIAFVANSYQVVEGGTVKIQLRRTGGQTGSMRVNVQISPNSTGLTLFGQTSWPVDFIPGQTCPATGDCTLSIDSGSFGSGFGAMEDGNLVNEVYTFSFSAANIQRLDDPGGTKASVGTPSSATLTVLDNDVPPSYSYEFGSYEFDEGAGTVSVNVIRSGSTAGTDSVRCVLNAGGGTPAQAADVSVPAGAFPKLLQTVTFSPGQTTRPCSFTIANDSIQEPDETLVLSFQDASSGFAAGTHATALVTILDDDGPGTFQFTADGFTVVEGTLNAALSIERTRGKAGTVVVRCVYNGSGSATPTGPNRDFESASVNVTFLNNQTTGACLIPIIDDALVEGPETAGFDLEVVSGGGLLGARSTTTLTIQDNDGAGSFRFTSATYTVAEDAGTAIITVQRVGGSSGGVVVPYTIADGTAVAGTHYINTPGSLAFASGETSKSFTVTLIDDDLVQPSRTVILTLGAPSGSAGLTAPSQATLTIVDDDVSVPVVSQVTPGVGPTTGGTLVTIIGSGFTQVGGVTFGALPAASFEVVSPTEIQAVAPAQGAGTVSVRVTNGAGTSADTAADDFIYTAGPIVTGLSPSSAPAGSTAIVTITGLNFGMATAVKFGETSVMFNVISATEIKAAAPALAGPGTVDVRVFAGPDLVSPVTAATKFTFTGPGTPPIVTGLSPSSIPVGVSGIEVTISGSGFAEPATVTFGGVEGTNVAVLSPTAIRVVAPRRDVPAVVEVVVSTPGGSSPTGGTQNDFAYGAPPGTTWTYTLNFRWTALTWAGKDNIGVDQALGGVESPDNPLTNDVRAIVTAIYTWSSSGAGCIASLPCWLAAFPNSGNIPGANDFTTLRFGVVYWVAVANTGGPRNWTILEGP